MPNTVKVIDPEILESLKTYPAVEMIKLLFPDVKMCGRSVMCNPLRGEKHPSLSCFRDRTGHQRWKDHATGETGDNIDFFRLANPALDYVDAVEAMAALLLGRSATTEETAGTDYRRLFGQKHAAKPHRPAEEEPSKIRVTKVKIYDPKDKEIPKEIINYTRRRGISDEVARKYLVYSEYTNLNRVGRSIIDPASGLPAVDDSGEILRDDGRAQAIAMMNDIGGFSLRTPDVKEIKGEKKTNTSFPATILANGIRPQKLIQVTGKESIHVEKFHYDPIRQALFLNGTQALWYLRPWAAPFAIEFLKRWNGCYIEGRDVRAVAAVLNALNGPVHPRVTVIEGMFDAMSVIELERLAGRGPFPGGDLVVLNSTSNLGWAIPFLSMHGEVCSLLDNDAGSSTGQKAFMKMKEEIAEFTSKLGVVSIVHSESERFAPYKDINEYLQHIKNRLQ